MYTRFLFDFRTNRIAGEAEVFAPSVEAAAHALQDHLVQRIWALEGPDAPQAAREVVLEGWQYGVTPVAVTMPQVTNIRWVQR